MSESAEHPRHTCHGEVSPGKGPIGPDHCDGCEYETEMGQLRAEVERLRAKVTELSDEAYGYAEQVERLEEWQRQMVQKAADNSLDGYRELGAKCASLEERAEKAERERDEARDKSLATIQGEIAHWHVAKFGWVDPSKPLLVAVGELGELAQSHVKAEQGHLRRYQGRDFDAEAKDAVGDVVIALYAYCARRGWELNELVRATWGEVSQRFAGESAPTAGGEGE